MADPAILSCRVEDGCRPSDPSFLVHVVYHGRDTLHERLTELRRFVKISVVHNHAFVARVVPVVETRIENGSELVQVLACGHTARGEAQRGWSGKLKARRQCDECSKEATAEFIVRTRESK